MNFKIIKFDNKEINNVKIMIKKKFITKIMKLLFFPVDNSCTLVKLKTYLLHPINGLNEVRK